jgi:hypothetical protein
MPEESRQQKRARAREAATVKQSQDKKLGKIVGGLVDGKPYEKWPAWNGTGVPIRENCDLTNPRTAFLWMFTAMPGMKGAPLMMPTEYWELQSFRMWVLGARPVAEPAQKWQAPVSVTANAWQAAGKWVDLDTPEPERKTIADLMRELPQKDRAEIRAAVLEGLGSDVDKPGPPAMQYTVAALADRLHCTVDQLVVTLGNLGVTNVHAQSRVGRDVADRIVEHMGLE